MCTGNPQQKCVCVYMCVLCTRWWIDRSLLLLVKLWQILSYCVLGCVRWYQLEININRGWSKQDSGWCHAYKSQKYRVTCAHAYGDTWRGAGVAALIEVLRMTVKGSRHYLGYIARRELFIWRQERQGGKRINQSKRGRQIKERRRKGWVGNEESLNNTRLAIDDNKPDRISLIFVFSLTKNKINCNQNSDWISYWQLELPIFRENGSSTCNTSILHLIIKNIAMRISIFFLFLSLD